MSPRGRFNLVMGVLVLAAVGFGVWRWRRQADEAAALSARIAAQTAQAQRAFAARNDPAGATPPRTDALAASALPPWASRSAPICRPSCAGPMPARRRPPAGSRWN